MLTAIRNFFTAPQYEGDIERTQDARTTHRVGVALLGLGLFATPFMLRLESPAREIALYSTAGGLVIWLLTIWLNKRGRTNSAKLIILGVNTINLLTVTFVVGGYERPTIMTTLLLIALATMLFPRRGAINYGTVLLVLSTVLFLLGRAGFVPAPTSPGDDLGTFFIFTFSLVAVTALLAIISVNVRSNLEHIRESQIELRDRNFELNEVTKQLEMRVEERTADLEESTQQLQKRASQFETIAQLARTINTIQDPETLLRKITELVSVSFGFYHVGLFLQDESRQYAVLSATNSEGGQKMLARKHRLGVGQTGIVGYVTATGNPRIALDTGADAVFFDNPDLPDTRSEMALPLRVGTTIVGALDVQSTEPNAFSEDDVEVLSILADVVSVAIENARLFEESQRVLAEAQTAFSETTLDAWRQIVTKRESVGYAFSGTSIHPLEKPLKNAETHKAITTGDISIGSQGKESKATAMAVPIKLRNRVVGTMNISLPENREWDPDEVDITQALAERVGVAIESATLLEESRRRAIQESMISNISAKISASAEVERIMQVAVGELRQALGASEVTVKIGTNELEDGQDES
jgi:GAF domain-containing protein